MDSCASPSGPAAIGLIAGDGLFPLEIARAVRRRGDRLIAVAFQGLTDPSLTHEVEQVHWIRFGQVEALLRALRDSGVKRVVMAGKVSKLNLFDASAQLRPDRRALKLLQDLEDHRDDSLLGALVRLLEAEGVSVRPQAELVPEFLCGAGPLGAVAPTAQHWPDIRFGWRTAKALAAADVGQSVVVLRRTLIAVEAIEGTDAAIRRSASLVGPGACVVKVAKPAQDPRFDLPAIGPGTLAAMVEAKACVLAFEADRTIVLAREELVRRADAEGICVVGVSASDGELA